MRSQYYHYFDKFGICDVCNKKQKKINWALRLNEFKELVKKIKKKNRNYDCLIPVSGGKDSTWQVIVAKKYGLKPLCVTWRSPARNKLGQQNLDNLKNPVMDSDKLTDENNFSSEDSNNPPEILDNNTEGVDDIND